jgi:hypothetical protein
MEYLRGNATASAIGLFVICRHLSNTRHGQSNDDLRRSLQPVRSQTADSTDSGAVLSASLNVGEGLGLVKREMSSGPWNVDADLGRELLSRDDPWIWFRGELLYRMAQHALRALTHDGKAPDLLVGLTWFLQLDPLDPIQSAWSTGPEPRVRSIGLDAVSNVEQWRPFQRWAIALGAARRFDIGNAKVVIPDATTAIQDQLRHLPADSNAREWFGRLRSRVPIFGAAELVSQLPQGNGAWADLPPGVVLGLLKLEKAGVLALHASDDAADIVTLSLGATVRQVGWIKVTETKR